jgi:hypothetical protein
MSTRLFKKALIVLFALAFTACSAIAPAASTPSAEAIEKEEQAIYSFFLPRTGSPVLILEETSADISSDNADQSIDYIKSDLEGVSKQTLNSFLERNVQPTQLSTDMDLGVEYTLLSTDDLHRIASQPNWGKLLEEEYPGAHGYTIFSRVGFNNSLDQALIYVGSVGGPLMGSGSYFLMEKQNGEWTMKDQIEAWIS